MLDLKNWFSPKHYKRLWNVGPPGLTVSLILIYLTLQYEAAFSIKKYETGHMWVDVLFFLGLATLPWEKGDLDPRQPREPKSVFYF